MSQVGAIDGDGLTVDEAPNVVPDDLFVAERGPTVLLGLTDELLHCATSWRDKQWLPRDRIIICDLPRVLRQRGQPRPRRLEGIARVLGVVPIVAADAIGCLHVAPVAQVLLDGVLSGAVGLLRHDIFAADDWISL